MEFKAMSAEEYRALNAEELSQRRDAVVSALEGNEKLDMEQVRSEIELIDAEYERRNAAVALRNQRAAVVAGGAGIKLDGTQKQIRATDPMDSAEYRNAFFEYMKEGTVGAELRSVGTTDVSIVDGYTKTTDVVPQIPSTMANQIVQKMEEYGLIWNKVRKLAVKGGLWFRVVDLDVEAAWIDESKVSNYQKVEANDKISFSFFELECRMSQSLLAAATTFDDFQALFAPAIAKAMVKAIEKAIFTGDGTTQPTGIFKDPNITTKGTVIEVSEADMKDWKAWHKNIWAKIPAAYRQTGEWTLALSTFDSYIATMADDNNAPVSIGYNPVTGDEIRRIIGREVNCVDEELVPDFDTANVGDIVGVFCDWNNYGINTQPGMPMSVVKWIDHETNTEKTKCLTGIDGKAIDPYGFVLLKKKASA